MQAGIDYSLGQSNIDNETGIHYGVIPAHELGQPWYDSSEAYYGEPACPECGSPVVQWAEKHDGYKGWGKASEPRHRHLCHAEFVCENCQLAFWTEIEDAIYPEEPSSWYYDDDGYIMEQAGDDCDVFILKSPFFTFCAFCSPCAPGAGYLLSQLPPGDGIKAYCPGSDWFDGDPPIAIYRVDTGEQAS